MPWLARALIAGHGERTVIHVSGKALSKLSCSIMLPSPGPAGFQFSQSISGWPSGTDILRRLQLRSNTGYKINKIKQETKNKS